MDHGGSLAQTLISSRLRPRDGVFRAYGSLVALLILYMSLNRSFPPRIWLTLVTSTIFLLVLICLGTLLTLNGSVHSARALLRQPKSWLLFALLTAYFVVKIKNPTSPQTYVDALSFSVVYLSIIFLDAMIDRPRVIMALMVGLMVAATARMIHALTLTHEMEGLVFMNLFGRPVYSRQIARSVVISLLLQMIEGGVFMIRGVFTPTTASYHNHFIFLRQLKPFREIDESSHVPPRCKTSHVTLAYVCNTLSILALSILYGTSFYFATPHGMPKWYYISTSVFLFTLLVGMFAATIGNFSKNAAVTLLWQPNIWIMLFLAICYCAAAFVYPPALTGALLRTLSVLNLVLTDTHKVTHTPALAILAVLGLVGMAASLVDFTISQRGQDLVLVSDGGFVRITLWDVITTVLWNYLLLFLESTVATIWYWKRERHCLFVRGLRSRGMVLFSTFETSISSSEIIAKKGEIVGKK